MHLFHTRSQTADVSICKTAQQQHTEGALLVFPKVWCPPRFKRSWAVCWQQSLTPLRSGDSHEARKGSGPYRPREQSAEVGTMGGPHRSGKPGPGLRPGEQAPENHLPRSHTRPGGPAAGSWGSRSLSFWKPTARPPGFAATTTIAGAQMVVL